MNPARFWDRTAERYSRQPVADEAAYQRKLEVTRKYFEPDMEVLEFGCGTGSTAIAHAPHVKHVLAIDFSEKMVEIARSKARAANVDNVTFQRSSIDELSAPDQSFDAVLGLSILHLLDDPDAAIARVERMLKPGGAFVTNTVCLGETRLRYLAFLVPIGRLLGLLPQVRALTVERLRRSLIGAGFEIDYEWRPDGNLPVAFIVARKRSARP